MYCVQVALRLIQNFEDCFVFERDQIHLVWRLCFTYLYVAIFLNNIL